MPPVPVKINSSLGVLIKETLPVVSPLFISYCIYDILRYLNISIHHHTSTTLLRYFDYSVLVSGFAPLLVKYCWLTKDSLILLLLDDFLFGCYVVLSFIGVCYAVLFHSLCLLRLYEKKWSNMGLVTGLCF